jgi:hypothetical protein
MGRDGHLELQSKNVKKINDFNYSFNSLHRNAGTIYPFSPLDPTFSHDMEGSCDFFHPKLLVIVFPSQSHWHTWCFGKRITCFFVRFKYANTRSRHIVMGRDGHLELQSKNVKKINDISTWLDAFIAYCNVQANIVTYTCNRWMVFIKLYITYCIIWVFI